MENIYRVGPLSRTILLACILFLSIASTLAQSGQTIKADFTQDKATGCLPLIVQFTNQSSGTGLNYFWDFGNGNTSALKNPGAIYTTSGNYTVKLIITDNNGSNDTVIKQMAVRAFANPEAAFTADARGACVGSQIAFSDTSTLASAPIVGWQWNFGDGASSLVPAPSHTFTSDGTFSVSLIVTDSNGCKDFVNKSSYIKTTIPAQVSFTADNKGACTVPLLVNYSSTSQLQQSLTYTYNWQFGNGDSSTAINPAITYANMGNYNVSLTITDNNNCAKILENNKFISIGKTKADFSIDNKKGCTPHIVKFTNTGTGIPSNATIVWYFGNGDSAIGTNAAYTYTQAGTYSVKMVVTSPNGCNDVIVKTDSITVLTAPTAIFGHDNPVNCTIPYKMNFSSGNTTAKSWLWDFGNGKTSTLEKPVTTFDSAGVFSVSLTITDANGCKGTFVKTKLVRVQTQKAAFTPSVTFGCAPLTVNFTNTSTAYFGIKDLIWNFGDGTTSTTKNPQITYNQAGVYHPKLILTDNNGCADTMVFDSIMAGVKTHPDFLVSQSTGCKNNMGSVKFTNKTNIKTQHIDGFFWDFGVATSTDINPSVNFNQLPAKYDVTLIAVSNGCADTIVKKNFITVLGPYAEAKIIEDPCKLDTIQINDISIGGYVFEWTLNNALVNNKSRNFKIYLNPGHYEFDMLVKDTVTGCQDTKNFSLTIHKPLAPGFTLSADSICANLPILLTDTSTGSVTSNWQASGVQPFSGKTAISSFSNPGKKDITLTVTDAYGCIESITKTTVLKVLGPDFQPTITPDKGCFPLNAQLIKTGHSEHGVAKTVWYTNYEKVDALTDTIPYTFTHQDPDMNTAGMLVYLAVTDNLGCKVSRTSIIKMSKPIAGVIQHQDLRCDRTDLEFLHNKNASQNVTPLTYQWLINDSLTGKNQNIITSFNTAQNAKVKLVITEPALGCSDSSTVMFAIKIKSLKAGFVADKTHTTCPPLQTTFADASTTENTTIASTKWWFGDGASSILPTPQKSYFYPGNFDITYKITDPQGCSDSIVTKSKIQIGGPIGSYAIDRYNGCVPFDANFTATSKTAKTVNWDLGNGKLNVGANTVGTYVLPGSYKPAMVLEDSSGCLVVYPVKDPIVGYATPNPDFTIAGKCANDKFIFTNTTDTNQLAASFEWIFSEKDNATTFNTDKTFGIPGKYDVVLKAIAANGCEGLKHGIVEIKNLKADFAISNTNACRSVALDVKDSSIAEAGIKTHRWILGDGRTDTATNLHIEYPQPGNFHIALIIEDNNGCLDSATCKKPVTVFDSLTPIAPYIHRVTVEQNNTVRLEFAPYPKADFGSYLIYRSLPGKEFELLKTITNPFDTVVIDNTVNTFASSYLYKIFTKTFCGKISADVTSNTHKTILLETIADTNIVRVRWNQYEGWQKIDQYQIFRKESADKDYSQLTIVPASMTSYVDEKAFCGKTYDYLVYAERASGGPMLSSSNFTSATPIYKADVYPGRIVRATVEDDKNILVEFAPNYKQITPVNYYTIEKSADGANYKEVFKSTDFTWSYLDEKVSVHSQSYYYRVRTTDVCGAVSDPGNIGKTILLNAASDNEDNVNVIWSGYQQWAEGIQQYEVELVDGNGNFTQVGKTGAIDTNYVDASNLFNQLAKVQYRVKAVSNEGVISYSNIDDVSGRSSLFAPNAFTPNKDEHNNKFVVVGAYIKKYEINIYDRYGEKIFTSNNLEDSWDGNYKGQPAQDGAYVYVINSLGMDAKYHNISGTVTLLR